MFFEEHQRFTHWPFVILMLSVNLFFIWVGISQLVLGKPWGNNPMSNFGLVLLIVFVLLFTLWFFFLRLDTIIDKDGIYVRFFLFHFRFKFYSWDEIEMAEVKKYRPVYSFGGWGIRAGFKSTAYTVSGVYGLELKLKNGKKLLIGTQKADELTKFLENI